MLPFLANRTPTLEPKTKVVVRRLPPTLPKDVFETTIAKWLSAINWLSYVPGKIARTKAKVTVFSRAYLNFSNTDALLDFYSEYNGHVFVDAKGRSHFSSPSASHTMDLSKLDTLSCLELKQKLKLDRRIDNATRCVVEFALFQQCLSNLARDVKPDRRLNTLDDDEEYLAFLDALNNPEPAPSPNDTADPIASAAKITSTPLLEHLRALKAAKDKNKVVAKKSFVTPEVKSKRALKREKHGLLAERKTGGAPCLPKSAGGFSATEKNSIMTPYSSKSKLSTGVTLCEGDAELARKKAKKKEKAKAKIQRAKNVEFKLEEAKHNTNKEQKALKMDKEQFPVLGAVKPTSTPSLAVMAPAKETPKPQATTGKTKSGLSITIIKKSTDASPPVVTQILKSPRSHEFSSQSAQLAKQQKRNTLTPSPALNPTSSSTSNVNSNSSRLTFEGGHRPPHSGRGRGYRGRGRGQEI